jgi:hypothetical protein
MVFNEQLLFLHVPKTGGMAITKALLEGLSGSVYCTAPKGHHLQRVRHEQVLQGIRHENIPQARKVLARLGRRLEDFECIIAVMRDPYELEASRFHYLRKGQACDRGPAQDLALAGDFEAFTVQSRWWFGDIADYYTLDGRTLPNLRLLRHERLAADFTMVAGPYLDPSTTLGRINVSGDSGAPVRLKPAAEEAIYRKYRWLFEAGHYARRLADTDLR